MRQISFYKISFLIMLLLTGSIILTVPNATALTAQEQKSKKDNQNIAFFETQLKEGEAVLKENFGGKSALKASNNALRFYKKLSSSAKSSSKIAILKGRLDALIDKAKVKNTQDSQIKKDLKHLKITTSYLNKVVTHLASDSVVSARRSLNHATSSFKKISATSLERNDVIDIESRINDLIEKIEKLETQSAERRQLDKRILYSSADFKTYVARNKILRLLAKGMNITNQYQLINSKELKQAYDKADFEDLKNRFEETYDVLLVNKPNLAKSSGFTPNDILDLYKNKVTYRNNFIVQNGKNHLNWKINHLKNKLETLNDKGHLVFTSNLLSELYGEKENAPFSEINDIKEYYDWIDQRLPIDEVNQLSEYKVILRKALENAAQKNKWDNAEYSYQNNRIVKRAQDICASKNTDLVKAAVTGKNDWRINKNRKGIPTSRHIDGFILCQHSDEPFKRGYNVRFTGTFNGVGYEPITQGTISNNRMKPYK